MSLRTTSLLAMLVVAAFALLTPHSVRAQGHELVVFLDLATIDEWMPHLLTMGSAASVVVRIEAEGGAGDAMAPALLDAMSSLQDANHKTFAMVATNGRSKSLSEFDSEVSAIIAQYGPSLDGIYVDHFGSTASSPSSPSSVGSYDLQISRLVRDDRQRTLFVNPRQDSITGCGDDTTLSFALEACASVADMVVAFDGSLTDFIEFQKSVGPTLSSNKFGAVVRAVSSASEANTVLTYSFVKNNFGFASVSSLAASSTTDFGSDPPVFVAASVSNMRDIAAFQRARRRRGVYVTPYTARAGRNNYVDNVEWQNTYEHILTSAAKREKLFDDLALRGFNAISLYNMGTIMDNTELRAHLRSFMAEARARGIESIEGVGSGTFEREQLAAFQNRSGAAGDTDAMFDGFVTEIEFWNDDDGDVTEVTDWISDMRNRSQPMQRFPGVELTYNVYAGWIEEADVRALVELRITSLWPHAYVRNASRAASYIGTRSDWALAAINDAALVSPESLGAMCLTPIFSAEGSEVRAGENEWFMGDEISDVSPNAVPKSEATLNDGIASRWPAEVGQFCGFQWYSDFYLREHAHGDVASSASPAPSPAPSRSPKSSPEAATAEPPLTPTAAPTAERGDRTDGSTGRKTSSSAASLIAPLDLLLMFEAISLFTVLAGHLS